MATTVSQAFVEFANKIKPTNAQQETINSRRPRVHSILSELFDGSSNMSLLGTYLIGSAARRTIIRPVQDVDVFAVFDAGQVWPTYSSDSTRLLYRVRDALAEKFNVTVVGARGQAVRLFYTAGPHVDIAPAFSVDVGGYYIPRGDGGWLQTDPFVHNDFLAERNQALGSYLKPLVRLLKRWNAVHSSRFKAFHLEMVTQQTFSSLSGSMRGGLEKFFEWAPAHLDVNDLAGYSGNLAAGWSWTHRDAVVTSLASANDRALKALGAEQRGDQAEAARLWRVILGSEFPVL
jgi:hypothetical protein